VKLLRNPVAVGVLALLAVVVMAYQFWPMLRPRFARTAPAAPSATPAVAPTAPAAPAKPAKPPADSPAPPQRPVASVEIDVLETNSLRWAEAPRNDPFKVRFYVSNAQGTTNRAAMEVLTLNAIWQQTDGAPLAVINNRLLGEGDVILEFKISTIEPDRVWVDGPNGREPVRFKLPTPLGEAGEIKLEKEVRVTPKSVP
jgi:hypothetical protein